MDKTSLAIAALQGRTAVVNFLLSHGADPNLADKVGWTPLMSAAAHNYYEIAKMLVDRGGGHQGPE